MHHRPKRFPSVVGDVQHIPPKGRVQCTNYTYIYNIIPTFTTALHCTGTRAGQVSLQALAEVLPDIGMCHLTIYTTTNIISKPSISMTNDQGSLQLYPSRNDFILALLLMLGTNIMQDRASQLASLGRGVA